MLALGLAAAVLPGLVEGHAYIFYPPPRQGDKPNANNGYEPQSLGSTTLPMDTCGKSKWLNFADGTVTEFTSGQHVKFEVKVTAHHKGHFVFRLCDRTINSSLGGMAGEEACLNEHVLERVRPEDVHSDCGPNDRRGDCQPLDEANPGHWYLPPPSYPKHYSFHYKLPAAFTCEKCTLQWWWMSANSCTPQPDAYNCYFGPSGKMQREGWAVSEWCSGACSFGGVCPARQAGPKKCGEQFKNCADLRIVAGGGQPVPTQPQTTRAPSTTSRPNPTTTQPQTTRAPSPTARPNPTTTEPEPESEEEEEGPSAPTPVPTGSPLRECKAVPGNSEGATDSLCHVWCATGYQGSPCNGETCSCSAGGVPSAPTVAPTPPPAGCVANPNLNRGVSDKDCEQCESGYKFWPCNEASLCNCGGSLLGTAAAERRAEVKQHRFLGLIQRGDEVQVAAFAGDDEL